MDTEKIAISTLQLCISKTDCLETYLNTGDKEPSWDGNIYIFKDKTKSKEGMMRIPVQVKGQSITNVRRKDENTILYSVDTSDLKNYNKDGGIIFFVVEIPESGDPIIYYAKLLPWDINEYLNKARTHNSISVEFQLFPSNNPKEIEAIIIRTSRDKQKQASIINCSSEDLERIKQDNYPQKFEISMPPSAFFPGAILKELNRQQPYVYACIENGFEIPIDKKKYAGIEFEILNKVSINGQLFYDKYKYKEDDSGRVIYMFGNHIQLIMDPPIEQGKSHHVHISHKIGGTLNQQIKDIEFFCEVIKNNGFEIEGSKQNWMHGDATELIKNKEATLIFLKRFRKALDKSGYPEDLSLEDFSDDTWQLVDNFSSIFLDDKTIYFKDLPDGLQYYSVVFGKTILPIIISKKDDNCLVYNIYTVPPINCVIRETGEKSLVSPYVVIPEEMLSSLTYLNFDLMFDGLINIEMTEIYHADATEFLLRILKVIDNNAPLKNEYLEFALKVAEWLNTSSEKMDMSIKEINLLNLMQVKKRLDSLDLDDINKLHTLLEDNPDMCVQNKVGLFILTEQFDRAQKYFAELSEEEQKLFLKFPIMHFWDYEKYPLPQVSSQEDNHAGETTEGAD